MYSQLAWLTKPLPASPHLLNPTPHPPESMERSPCPWEPLIYRMCWKQRPIMHQSSLSRSFESRWFSLQIHHGDIGGGPMETLRLLVWWLGNKLHSQGKAFFFSLGGWTDIDSHWLHCRGEEQHLHRPKSFASLVEADHYTASQLLCMHESWSFFFF